MVDFRELDGFALDDVLGVGGVVFGEEIFAEFGLVDYEVVFGVVVVFGVQDFVQVHVEPVVVFDVDGARAFEHFVCFCLVVVFEGVV